MIHSIRRPLYLFLSGLMGLLMFFILQRIVVFFYLFIATLGDSTFQYYSFQIWDYSTLFIVLVCGAVYGLWVGRYWYKSVYHENLHSGFVDFLNGWLWREKKSEVIKYEHKLETVTQKLEENLKHFEQVVENPPVPVAVKPIRRTSVRAGIKKPTLAKAKKTTSRAKKASA